MHATALCSVLFGLAFLEAVSTAAGTWPEKPCVHCSEPMTMVDVIEDGSALLQAGSLNLRSKTNNDGDHAPAKERRPTVKASGSLRRPLFFRCKVGMPLGILQYHWRREVGWGKVEASGMNDST
eukprot:TRINITY_DN2918_c0_g1_i7.p3 TRINITY_DN2918_c0_g1~~TRINITY_DN2918_c0_g1_i7.p3  ORF type:complete len:135 (+),score=7.99 TRINITY_DN2918_c0_g1_i7:34-405(+)